MFAMRKGTKHIFSFQKRNKNTTGAAEFGREQEQRKERTRGEQRNRKETGGDGSSGVRKGARGEKKRTKGLQRKGKETGGDE
jgi:hypothetical protein